MTPTVSPSVSPSPVLVVGGGIGGLAAGIALALQGRPVRVVEQAPALAVVGAGIGIQPNATAVLGALGVDLLAAGGVVMGPFQMVSASGRVLMGTDPATVARLAGAAGAPPAVNIHRAALQAALLARFEALGGRLELGRRLVALEPEDAVCTAIFEDGERIRSPLVVGADGLHSAVRRALRGASDPPLRPAGQTCWRFAERVPFALPARSVERWLPGRRVGLLPLGGGMVYSYLVASAPPGSPGPGTATAAAIHARFHGDHPALDPVLDHLLAREQAGDPPAIHHGDLLDQPAVDFGAGPVVLLGDAAHAVTPNMGQGAGLAIEDAAALALCVAAAAPGAPVGPALDRMRRARVVRVQRDSWQLGAVSHWAHPWATAVRDRLLSWVPAGVMAAQLPRMWAPGLALAGAYAALPARA